MIDSIYYYFIYGIYCKVGFLFVLLSTCFFFFKGFPTKTSVYRSFATRVSQLKIWHFWVTGIERNDCRCAFNSYCVITQSAKRAAGEQFCRRCTHRKLQHFKTFKRFSWKITNFELWHCCRKGAIYSFYSSIPVTWRDRLRLLHSNNQYYVPCISHHGPQ